MSSLLPGPPGEKLYLLPLPRPGVRPPTLAPPGPACAPRPRPGVRMRPEPPPSRTTQPPGERVRAPLPVYPLHPSPLDLLYCLQTPHLPRPWRPQPLLQVPRCSIGARVPLRQLVGRCRACREGDGGDAAPCSDPGPRAPARRRRHSARAPRGLCCPRARRSWARAAAAARAQLVKKEKKGEKIESGSGCSSDPPPDWARPSGGRASRRSRGEAAAIHGGPG